MNGPWLYRAGVPAAGHITSHGFWHPGRISGCQKCPPLSYEDDRFTWLPAATVRETPSVDVTPVLLIDEDHAEWAGLNAEWQAFGPLLNDTSPDDWAGQATGDRYEQEAYNRLIEWVDAHHLEDHPTYDPRVNSPADAVDWAAARDARRRSGIGRWTLEVEGDGENTPLVLRVVPAVG